MRIEYYALSRDALYHSGKEGDWQRFAMADLLADYQKKHVVADLFADPKALKAAANQIDRITKGRFKLEMFFPCIRFVFFLEAPDIDLEAFQKVMIEAFMLDNKDKVFLAEIGPIASIATSLEGGNVPAIVHAKVGNYTELSFNFVGGRIFKTVAAGGVEDFWPAFWHQCQEALKQPLAEVMPDFPHSKDPEYIEKWANSDTMRFVAVSIDDLPSLPECFKGHEVEIVPMKALKDPLNHFIKRKK